MALLASILALQIQKKCIYACNIINNEQFRSDERVVHVGGELFINCSWILCNHNCERFFDLWYGQFEDYWYCSKVILTGCTTDVDINAYDEGSLAVVSTIKSSFINRLTNIAMNNCDSSFDSLIDSYDLHDYEIRTVVAPMKRNKKCVLKRTCKHKRPMIDPHKCTEYIFLMSMIPSKAVYKNLLRTEH